MQNVSAELDTSAREQIICHVIDHLVDALGGEPSCTVRRAVILCDIYENNGTTQNEILKRLDGHKSSLNRDIEWLYDYGCVLRRHDEQDARLIRLYICGYAKNHVDYALGYFDYDFKSLKKFLTSLTNVFQQHKPTLRDAKIIAALNSEKAMTRQEIFENLYNGPATTDNRAVTNLMLKGLIKQNDER